MEAANLLTLLAVWSASIALAAFQSFRNDQRGLGVIFSMVAAAFGCLTIWLAIR